MLRCWQEMSNPLGLVAMPLPCRMAALLLLGLLPIHGSAAQEPSRRDVRAAVAPVISSPFSRSGAVGDDDWQEDAPAQPRSPATYRTICVRLCDGYYFPISFRTSRLGLESDAAKCSASCSGEATLFFHANPGGDVASARDFTGMQYESLPNAFKYLKQRVEGCSCKPQPWSDEEQQRHRIYAEARKKGMATPLQSPSTEPHPEFGERPLALARRAPAPEPARVELPVPVLEAPPEAARQDIPPAQASPPSAAPSPPSATRRTTGKQRDRRADAEFPSRRR